MGVSSKMFTELRDDFNAYKAIVDTRGGLENDKFLIDRG